MPGLDDPASNALEALLRGEIRAQGPITVARYMTLALQHPELGYYRRRQPLGAGGDFTSAPEVSQMFGELLGLWLAQAWIGQGRPQPVRLVELGPGRGTMLADVLRALAAVPDLSACVEVHLVETSPRLRAAQKARLAGERVRWHEDLGEVPAGVLLLVANEFLDALPVHQLVRTERGWAERRVGLKAAGRLAFVEDQAPAALAAAAPPDAPAGSVTEVSPARAALVAAIARRLVGSPGVALLIDYGAWPEGPTGDTLQAVRGHAACDPLATPGEADLSTQVDFRALAEAAQRAGAAVYGPVPQGAFLRALGIELRALKLMAGVAPEARRELRAALFRLTDAGAMGELFKVMALAGPAAPPPPGFHAATLTP